MSMDKRSKRIPAKPNPPNPDATAPLAAPAAETLASKIPPLFRRIDWLTFLVTTFCVWLGYFYTLAPDLTLEDSGELAVASFYAGIPHPPGYPVWTLYTYLWANLLPIGNIAWRVALGEATAGALACGLLGLLISRGSSMLMEGIGQLKAMTGKWENAICIVSGFVGGLLLGFNGYMWSQSVIVEVYSFSVLSLVAVLLFLLRWVYAPHQNRYLLLAFFMYGICVNNHQSLLPIAMGLETLIIAVRPKLGREFLFWNVCVYLVLLWMGPTLLAGNKMVYLFFNIVGLSSIAGWIWISIREKQETSGWIGGGMVAVTALLFLLMKLGIKEPTNDYEVALAARKLESIVWLPLLGLAGIVACRLYAAYDAVFMNKLRRSRDWLVTLGAGGTFTLGMAFYLYMPLAGATNPPMQWGYPRTLEGFIHAFTRGQYEKIRPTDGVGEGLDWFFSFVFTYAKQLLMYFDGLDNEFNLVCVLIAISVFLFYRLMQKRERSWLIGLTGIFICLGPLLVFLMAPPPDRAARELVRVFFTASHVLVSMGVGFGIALLAAALATHYQNFRRIGLGIGIVAVDLALYSLAVETYSLFTDPEIAGANQFMNALVKITFLLLTGTCLGVAILQLMRTSESPEASRKPIVALAGLGFICMMICFVLFRGSLPPSASPEAKLGGLAAFGFLLKNNADIGTDAPTLLAIAKLIAVLFTAVALFIAQQSKQPSDRSTYRFLGWGIMGFSLVLTLVILMGEQISPAGIGVFFSTLFKIFDPGQFSMPVLASLLMFGLAVAFLLGLIFWKQRAPLALTLGLFTILPLQSFMGHWADNEQRGHLFGYWFGHDMFTPPFKDQAGQPLYPEMTRNAILYGGTDPGRFCPTYTIFCESFIPPECKPRDPEYDRRDVYIITQNALADGTYLNYIRAHYNRSAQKIRGLDTPFFQEVFRSEKERRENITTNAVARLARSLDVLVNSIGESIEKDRRAGSSFFKDSDFLNLDHFAATLRTPPNDFTKRLADRLRPETKALLGSDKSSALKAALIKDLNQVLEQGLYDDSALATNVLKDWQAQFEYEDIHGREQSPEARANPAVMQRILSVKAASVQKLTALKAERKQLAEQVERQLTAEGVPLTPRLKSFIYEAPQSFTRIRLQRQLIEAAFPQDIAVSPGGVYPDQEMYIASPVDSQDCFNEYLTDAQKRLQAGQLKPGEDVRIIGGKVQVSGQVAVMAINGLLTKVMFDENPDNEFFVEESFPLDWMYPHLTPFGVIMKINRQPLLALSEDVLARDHEFWSQYSERLIGNWITSDTPISDIVKFVEKVYLRHNWGDLNNEQRKFARDDNGQKAFSKLRSSIGGIYAWRLGYSCPPEYRPKTEAEIRRLYQEADFTFKQAFAFCPYSPEALFRYVQLLVNPPAPLQPRIDDALALARTALKLDPYNGSISGLINNLEDARHRVVDTATLQKLEAEVKANPSNFTAMLNLAFNYLQTQQYDRGYALLDAIIASPQATLANLAPVIEAYKQLQNLPKVEQALTRLTQIEPANPEAWYELGAVRIRLQKSAEAFHAISNALTLSRNRRAKDPQATDLIAIARADQQLAALRANPEFEKLLAP